jgi:hypothetical protein
VASLCACARIEPAPATPKTQLLAEPVPRRALAPGTWPAGPPAPEQPASELAPLKAMVLTVDGKAVAIQSAIALEDGHGAGAVYLTNFPYTCKELLDRFRPSYPDEFELMLRIGTYLHRDGKRSWAIRGMYSER